VDAEWLDLPALQNFGANLLQARLDRGYSQVRIARECKLGQAQVSLFEGGRRLPSLDQFVRLARALGIPLQRLLSGSDRPGIELKDLAFELRLLGAVDIWVCDAGVPGAARRPEEVIALAASGRSPDPRVVETLPALLSWNDFNPTVLRAHGIATKTTYRLGWLADIALTIDRQAGFPGGCRRSLLERFLKTVKLPPAEAQCDDLGRPSKRQPASPIWRRWKIRYGATIDDFKRRATELAAMREAPKMLPRPGRTRGRATIKTLEGMTTVPKMITEQETTTVPPRKARKGKADGR
jgi:transcriptional regulator with XRE-family HTH domain